MAITNLTDLIDSAMGSNTAAPDKSPEIVDKSLELLPPGANPDMVALPLEEKKRRAYDMKIRGIPVKSIATQFATTPEEIYSWYKSHILEFRAEFEKDPAANIISEAFLWFSRLEELSLYEYTQLTAEAIGKKSSVGRHMAKVKYLQTAMRARQSKINLLQDTGVLPKEIGRIYHAMAEENKPISAAEAGAENSPMKSRDEILNVIEKLVTQGRSL